VRESEGLGAVCKAEAGRTRGAVCNVRRFVDEGTAVGHCAHPAQETLSFSYCLATIFEKMRYRLCARLVYYGMAAVVLRLEFFDEAHVCSCALQISDEMNCC
jgi:hypothetical protein